MKIIVNARECDSSVLKQIIFLFMGWERTMNNFKHYIEKKQM